MGQSADKRNITIGCTAAIASTTIFGFSFLFTKNATEQASPFALLAWRYFVAAILISICAAAGILKINLKGKPLKPLLLIVLFCPVIYFIGETFGISKTTASESGAFVACIPVFSLIASTLILKKRPTRVQVAGILITLIGVLFTVFAAGMSASFSAAGYAALLIAVVSYPLYSVSVEKTEVYTGEEITFVMQISGAVVFLIIALAESCINRNISGFLSLPFTNRDFLVACLYQGVCCSILAFFLQTVAISKVGVNRSSSFVGIGTVVSIISSVIILKEPFTAYQIIGVALILAGVYIANIKIRR